MKFIVLSTILFFTAFVQASEFESCDTPNMSEQIPPSCYHLTGVGSAISEIPPECDVHSMTEAKALADQDARKQCHGFSRRISEYVMSCKILAHGYAAVTEAKATYLCSIQ